MIKKLNKIIYAVASRVQIKNTKYGMRIPTSITEAYEIDKENGNTLWRDVGLIGKYLSIWSSAGFGFSDIHRQSSTHNNIYSK